MRQKHVAVVLALAGSFIVLSFFLLLLSSCNTPDQSMSEYINSQMPSSVVTPVVSGTATVSPPPGTKDPQDSSSQSPDWISVIAAIPGAIAIILAALIGNRQSDVLRFIQSVDQFIPEIKTSLEQQQTLLENIERRFNATAAGIIRKYQHQLSVRFWNELNPDNRRDLAQIYLSVRMDEFQSQQSEPDAEYDTVSQIRQKQRALERNVDKFAKEWSLDERTGDTIEALLARLVQKKQFRVYGTSGVGKTTLLKFLAWLALKPLNAGMDEPVFPLPIYIDGKTFADFMKTRDTAQATYSGGLQEALIDYEVEQIFHGVGAVPDENRAKVKSYLQEAMKNGNVLLLLDELQNGENAFETNQDFITSGINELLGANFRVVLAQSSDMPTVLNTDAEIANNKILALCPEDIDLFVHNRFIKEHDREADFIRMLHRYPRIQALCANPFLLKHIVEKYANDQSTLQQRHEHFSLYKGCVDILLGRPQITTALRKLRESEAAQNPSTSEKAQYEDLQKLLRHMAWYLHNHTPGIFKHTYRDAYETELHPMLPPDEAGSSGDEQKKKWITYLDILIAKSGLFTPLSSINLGNQQITYKFAYPSLEEYFAACYVRESAPADQDGLWAVLEENHSEPWWEEVLLLSLTDAPSRANKLLTNLARNAPVAPAPTRTGYVDNNLLENLIFKIRVISMNRSTPANNYQALENEILSFLVKTECLYAQTRMIYAAYEIGFTQIELQRLLDMPIGREDGALGGDTADKTLPEKLHDQHGIIPVALLPLVTAESDNLAPYRHLQICERFLGLWGEMDLDRKERIIRHFWVNWGDYNPTERIYIAYTLGMLGVMGRENKNTFMVELIEKLESETTVDVSWIIAFSVALFSDYSDLLTERLLDLLKDQQRSLLARWNALNILYVFATFGKRSVARELGGLVKNAGHEFNDRIIIWHIAVLAKMLDPGIDLEDMQQKYSSSSIVSGVAAGLLKNPVDENIIHRITGYFDGNAASLEDRLRLVDILAKMASSLAQMTDVSAIIDKFNEIQKEIQVSDWLYKSILFRVMHIMKSRMQTKNGRTLHV